MFGKRWLVVLALILASALVLFYVILLMQRPMASTPSRSCDEHASPTSNTCQCRILVFSKTGAFRHASIKDGVQALRVLAAEHAYLADFTEDASVFTATNLVRYAAVVFLLTTGTVLDTSQKSAFERYIEAGGGYVGVHSASDTEYSWAWYGGLVGAYFDRIHGHSKVVQATIDVVDRTHPSTVMLSAHWARTDEWYNFATNPRGRVHVLMTMDESTYTGGVMGADHPIAWYHDYDGGRAWYTALGHTSESYYEPLFLAHLWGGITYAVGSGSKSRVTSSYRTLLLVTAFLDCHICCNLSARVISHRRRSMAKEMTAGVCSFCKGEFPKAKMLQHLKSCQQRTLTYAAEPTAAAKTAKSRRPTKTRLLHLQIEGRDHPQYWMHLEVPASIVLLALDSFLRGIWLECCGHLSAFKIENVLYASDVVDVEVDLDELNASLNALATGSKLATTEEKPNDMDLAEDSSKQVDLFPPKLLSRPVSPLPAEEPDDLLRMLSRELLAVEVERAVKERSMFIELEKVLKVGLKFSHEYDFGSTTELKLRVIAEREAEVRGRKSIQILARNVPPKIPCKVCGGPATRIEAGYFYAQDGAYCGKCARKGGLYVEEMLPVVNSPRVGVCGYTG